MAHIKDLWTRPKRNPDGSFVIDGRGKRVREKDPARWGRGNRWLLQYVKPNGTDGSRTYETLEDAKFARINVEADIVRGEYIDPQLGQIKFRDLAQQWRDNRIVSPKAAEREDEVVRYLNRRFGNDEIGKIRKSGVESWRKARSKTVSPSTVNLELRVFKAIMQLAADDDLIRRSPAAKVSQLKVPRREFKLWSLETIRLLIEAHEGRSRFVPTLSFGAGLRQGEAFGVGRDDLDALRRKLRVQRQIVKVRGAYFFKMPKRGSVGTVSLEQEVVDALAALMAEFPPIELELPWLEEDDEPLEPGFTPRRTLRVPLLYVGPRNGIPNRVTYNNGSWHPALAKAGLIPPGTKDRFGKTVYKTEGKASGIHNLRHAFASYQLYEGRPLIAVQQQLRHSRLDELVETYAHVIEDAEANTMEDAIASVFRPRSSVPVPSLFRQG
jgi:integrase